MTDLKKKDQAGEALISNITEKAFQIENAKLRNELETTKELLRGYKDFVWKVYATDWTQVKLIFTTQNLAEIIIPIDTEKAKEDKQYREEMLRCRWHFAIALEMFCNDYVERMQDPEFRKTIQEDMNPDNK